MKFFDDKDTLDASARMRDLFDGFNDRLETARSNCPGLARHHAEVLNTRVHDSDSLRSLPILRKADVMQAQQEQPPFGGFVNVAALSGSRWFMSPGPVWEPQLPIGDPWQSARALHAAGFTSGMRVHNAFSYHLTPGGFILDEGARALGCIVFPAGIGNTEVQVEALHHTASEAYVGTPDYLQTLLDHASEQSIELPQLKRAMVSGGALFPAMREKYQSQGIDVMQCYATADLGVIAYETASDGQLHAGMVINEGLIVEIVIPGTAIPVSPGEVGELIVTRLHPDFPLVRFATGDLSAEIVEPSPCGRSQKRIKGWMGRADQRAKVRGMFVDPLQLKKLADIHPELQRWRLVVDRDGDRDVMNLKVVASGDEGSLKVDALENTLKKVTNLSGTVEIVAELPSDGVVIDDQRDYSQ